jgi:cytochrome d ubiquinol oxidase subunit II
MELYIAFFLVVSLLLYVVLAGADFGIGMLEWLCPSHLRESMRRQTYKAIGPVWEANHMWLILAVVILFVAFPKVYVALSVSLHIPVSLLLLGIILRGCAFTFRHYDAVFDGSQKYYSLLFTYSSFWTSLLIGVVFGSILQAKMLVAPTDFYSGYLAPWLGVFPLAVGLFVVCINMLLAAAYMIGEPIDDELKLFFIRKTRQLIVACVVVGGVVFYAAYREDLAIISTFFQHPASLVCFVVATLLLPLLFVLTSGKRIWMLRIVAATLVSLVVLGCFAVQYPVLIRYADSGVLTIHNSSAPEATLRGLLYALVIGIVAIFPAIAYLFHVFKRSPKYS